MNFLYNNPILKNRRKDLRKKQTDAEKLLWMKLKNKQIQGTKFYRQYSIGSFITDFYCPDKRLAIEIDGSGHTEEKNKIYDIERSKYFSYRDIRVIRFWNNDVIKNMSGILERITKEVNTQ